MSSESNLNLKNSGGVGAKGKELKIEKFKIPHTYVIIAGMIILSFIGTYIIPAGVYERVKDVNSGRMIIAPETFTYVANTPVFLIWFKKQVPLIHFLHFYNI